MRRDLYDAACASDAWSMILDTMNVMNFDHGPFLSRANFDSRSEAIQLFSEVADHDDELLLDSYKEVCQACGDYRADVGSEAHVTSLLQGLASDISDRLVERVKWAGCGLTAEVCGSF